MKVFSAALVTFSLIAFYTIPVFADTIPGGGGVQVTINNPLDCPDFSCVANKIIDGLIVIASPILIIVVLYGGFVVMLAGGNPEKLKTGKHTLLWGAVGFVIVIVAKSVALILQSILGGS